MRELAPALLAGSWVLAQIAYPLTSSVARDRITVLIVLLSAATALTHAATTRGARFAIGLLVAVSGVGLVAEIIGTTTGYPFGCYAYATAGLGPAVAGVPLVIALAWTGGLYPVWMVAGAVADRTSNRIALTAVGAVGWDLFLDPQMVADGRWTWCDEGSGLPGLPAIPYTNYLGWFAVALLMAVLLTTLARRFPPLSDPAPTAMFVPIAVFLWTWFGSILAHAVFLGLPRSAAYGGVGFGILGVGLLWRSRRRGPLLRADRDPLP
ncbi:carotenoid biosynthesis protein [Nocardia callitridis]|uniref:Carotenoid biosynthesis protein n=1 Tax=Nocardia callitridis TaxID=648753 RepID=A0ABP9KHB1_9NOCA